MTNKQIAIARRFIALKAALQPTLQFLEDDKPLWNQIL